MKPPLMSRVILLATLGFLYAPIVVLFVLSFNNSRFSAHWSGFTLRWYVHLLQSPETKDAIINTMVVSLSSTLIATTFGTLLAVALDLYSPRIAGLVSALLYAPIILPDILIAITTLACYVVMHVPLGRFTIILAHIAFQISFVALVVRGRLQEFPRATIEAARDLGASQVETLRRVVLPMLVPGIVTGALLAFALSVDDFVITYFTAGAGSSTLPLRIYSMVKRGVTPDINALSSIMLLITLGAVLLAARIRKAPAAAAMVR